MIPCSESRHYMPVDAARQRLLQVPRKQPEHMRSEGCGRTIYMMKHLLVPIALSAVLSVAQGEVTAVVRPEVAAADRDFLATQTAEPAPAPIAAPPADEPVT